MLALGDGENDAEMLGVEAEANVLHRRLIGKLDRAGTARRAGPGLRVRTTRAHIADAIERYVLRLRLPLGGRGRRGGAGEEDERRGGGGRERDGGARGP